MLTVLYENFYKFLCSVKVRQCPFCSRQFSSSGLSYHVNEVHGVSRKACAEKILKCFYCSLTFGSQKTRFCRMKKVHEKYKVIEFIL